jgi:TrpR-related protein YerC/YecD
LEGHRGGYDNQNAESLLTKTLYFGKVGVMSKDVSNIWNQEMAQQLAEALVSIDDVQVMQNFLSDVLTEKEVAEVSARLEAARMLTAGETYAAITKKTKLSSRTVARISDWLKDGCNGYQAALKTLNVHHVHMPPVRAE